MLNIFTWAIIGLVTLPIVIGILRYIVWPLIQGFGELLITIIECLSNFFGD